MENGHEKNGNQKLQELDSVTIEQDEIILKAFETIWRNFISVSIHTYELFMALSEDRSWNDAFLCYVHLCYTARLQKTTKVWANRNYLMKGLHWGTVRVQNALLWLRTNGFIEIQNQKKYKNRGKWGKVFITIKYIPESTVVSNNTTDRVKNHKEKERTQSIFYDNTYYTTKHPGFKRDRSEDGDNASEKPAAAAVRIPSVETRPFFDEVYRNLGLEPWEARKTLRHLEIRGGLKKRSREYIKTGGKGKK